MILQVVCSITCSYFSHLEWLSWHHVVLWSQGTSRAGCPNRVETPGHLWATLPLYLNVVGRSVCWWQGPWHPKQGEWWNRSKGHPSVQFIAKGDGAKEWTRSWGPSKKKGWRQKRRQTHLPCHSGWDWRRRLKLEGNAWTLGEMGTGRGPKWRFSGHWCLQGWCLAAFCTLWVQEKTEHIWRKRQMMCQRSRVVYITHSTVPTGIYTKLKLSESFFAPGNMYKITDIWQHFSYKLCKHIPAKASGEGKEVCGVGKYFFPTSPTLECSPVIAPSTHTGLFIPVQSPLIYILKSLKQHFASSNHHPECSKRSWQYRQYSCMSFFKALLMSLTPSSNTAQGRGASPAREGTSGS